jgi:hypothetical protein
MSDLVERLVDYCVCDDGYPKQCAPCAAAEEIERLRERIEELESEVKALTGTVEGYEFISHDKIDAMWELANDPSLTYLDRCYHRKILAQAGIVECEVCGGIGRVPTPTTYAIETGAWDESCPACHGRGWRVSDEKA